MWISSCFILYVFFPQVTDNVVQIIMKDMAVKIVLLYLTQFQRPHIQIIFSRCVFFKNGLPGSFQNQIHLVHSHISDPVNKDLLNEQGCNIDLCGYPHEEEEILDPLDTIREYQERRTTLNAEIDKVLAELEALLPGGVIE